MKDKKNTLKSLQDLILDDNLIKIILSNPEKKSNDLPKKIIIRKFNSKQSDIFQFEYFIENKVIHKNKEKSYVNLNLILDLLEEDFKKCDIFSLNYNLTILKNKSNLFKVTGIKKVNNSNNQVLGHNKTKNYILKEPEKIQWLEKLGITNKSGQILKNKEKKFKQINKFLEILESVEKHLNDDSTIVDMGCGKSYLTFAMYYYFNKIKKKNVKVKGFDLKKDIIESCNNIAKNLNYENLEFFNEDISKLKYNEEKIDMLISLHACDTATDYALFYGFKYNCKIIMSVPCCQHELFNQIKNNDLQSMLRYGILKEKFSSLLTDTLRAEMLRLVGYNVDVLEFIEMEHTPKNIMIKAIKNYKNYKVDSKKLEEYETLIKQFNVNPKIYKIFKDILYEN